MKKYKMIIFACIIAIFGMPVVNAACEAAESNRLRSLSNNVKASHEVIVKEMELGENDNTPDGLTDEEIENFRLKKSYFKIDIRNVTEELEIVVTNNNTKTKTNYSYKDAVNGTISFENEVTDKIVKYTIDVYSTSASPCGKIKLNTIHVTTPAHNNRSNSSKCMGIEEYYLCHEYLYVNTDFSDFSDLTYEYKKNKEKEQEKADKDKNEGIFGFIKENKLVVIITTISVIAVGGIVTVIIVKKQRSRIV